MTKKQVEREHAQKKSRNWPRVSLINCITKIYELQGRLASSRARNPRAELTSPPVDGSEHFRIEHFPAHDQSFDQSTFILRFCKRIGCGWANVNTTGGSVLIAPPHAPSSHFTENGKALFERVIKKNKFPNRRKSLSRFSALLILGLFALRSCICVWH